MSRPSKELLSFATLRLDHAPAYARLMRFDRPIGIYLLLWPTMWGLWFAADGWPSLTNLAVFIAGVVLMRAAGCVINDYFDRDFDAMVQRTRDRPLARAEIDPGEALSLFVALMAIAASLLFFTNTQTILLGAIGGALAATYPLLKRVTHLPQLYLGLAFAWSIPMAYAAEAETIGGETWLVFLAALCWTTAYDTFYAMVDRDDDRLIGIRSTALLFGRKDRLAIALFDIATLSLLGAAGWMHGFQNFYWLGLVSAAALFGYQLKITRKREPAAAFAAFLNNRWVGLVVFLGLFLETL